MKSATGSPMVQSSPVEDRSHAESVVQYHVVEAVVAGCGAPTRNVVTWPSLDRLVLPHQTVSDERPANFGGSQPSEGSEARADTVACPDAAVTCLQDLSKGYHI